MKLHGLVLTAENSIGLHKDSNGVQLVLDSGVTIKLSIPLAEFLVERMAESLGMDSIGVQSLKDNMRRAHDTAKELQMISTDTRLGHLLVRHILDATKIDEE